MNYLDSSALIKRFALERGREWVLRLTDQDQDVVTATIACVEIYSGLTRQKNRGSLSPRQYVAICGKFEADWPSYRHVQLTPEVLRLARDLIRRHGLRGADAIHVASALELQKALGEPVLFVAAAGRLLSAAAAEGLETLNPETGKAL